MATWSSSVSSDGAIRPSSVAGSFYPAEPAVLGDMVEELLGRADRLAPAAEPVGGRVLGLLVPHAGLVYSGVVAAAGWRLLDTLPREPSPTVVILGTNHGAGWLHGVAAWELGAWRTPLGDSRIDADLGDAILALGRPFVVDHRAHIGEHSIEVQLPLLQAVRPGTAIVPLSVATGTDDDAIGAGTRLGELLRRRCAEGASIVLAISSDMAHYPPNAVCAQVTIDLLGPIARLDPGGLAAAEREVVRAGSPGLVCGMCGIGPTVLGLAALRAMGASRGSRLAAATSADAGGSTRRTVGYLAVGFTA